MYDSEKKPGFFCIHFYNENILIIFASSKIKLNTVPRRRTPRKIVEPPKFKGFQPYGYHGGRPQETVNLLYEEYEAIKLADYDGMSHHHACVLMGISRPTFARIYESARQKIARALVEVREVRSVYGNVSMKDNWLKCRDCYNLFTIPEPQNNLACPICKSSEIETIHTKNQ